MRTILDLPRETLELICDAARTEAFIKDIHSRPSLLPRARCQHLAIDRLWSVDPLPLAAQQDMIDSEILEYLIGLFSYTIVMLHQLKFVDYFSLYIQDIQDIGRIENLRDLHLHMYLGDSLRRTTLADM
ncbi:hypothetical protein PGT21_035500 [Puccinia graminis f. sp. tritici]|uniref:Uncharacterized protein n=1 Tax=Puccinia graminis f. sp. tritici TaxID=56615 RepID=A0A5B0Q0C6_PUCGR|nr:hypothetical protein PGT21_035500 [Puccinia graminis f. sp. tritici]KAA1126320.1 hypothetical protein PGTUg99_026603 [Puccinia graminis f. sp. tritici]